MHALVSAGSSAAVNPVCTHVLPHASVMTDDRPSSTQLTLIISTTAAWEHRQLYTYIFQFLWNTGRSGAQSDRVPALHKGSIKLHSTAVHGCPLFSAPLPKPAPVTFSCPCCFERSTSKVTPNWRWRRTISREAVGGDTGKEKATADSRLRHLSRAWERTPNCQMRLPTTTHYILIMRKQIPTEIF